MKKSKSKLKTDEHLAEHMGTLVKWAGICNVHLKEDFDDCLQDNMMVYLSACDKFDETKGSSFNSYLYNLLKWHYVDKLKKKNKEPEIISLDITFDEDLKLIDQIPNTPNPIHTPIVMLRYKGYTMSEIAEMLNMSERTVYRLWEKEKEEY